MTWEVIVGIASAVATIAAAVLTVFLPSLIARWKPRAVQQYKLAYVKLNHLSRGDKDSPPLYKRYIKRLKKEVDVYDEVHLFRLNIFYKKQAEFATYDRSSGAIDLQILHPWQELMFPDLGAAKVEDVISQTIRKKSRVFFTHTIRYNGFQPGNTEFSTRMETDVEEVRFIMDFSSLINFSAIQPSEPGKALLVHGTTKREIDLSSPSQGVFLVEAKNLEKDDVIKVDFSIDWDAVDQQRHMETK